MKSPTAFPTVTITYALIGDDTRREARSRNGRVSVDTRDAEGKYRPMAWIAIQHESEPDLGHFQYTCLCRSAGAAVEHIGEAGAPCPYFQEERLGIRAISIAFVGPHRWHRFDVSGAISSESDPYRLEARDGDPCGASESDTPDAFLAGLEIVLQPYDFTRDQSR